MILGTTLVLMGVALGVTWVVLNPPKEISDARMLEVLRQAIKEVCNGEEQERIAKYVVRHLRGE